MGRFKPVLLLLALPLVLSVAASARAQDMQADLMTDDLFSGVSPLQLVKTLLATGVGAPEVDFNDPNSFSFSAFIPSPPIPSEPLQPPTGASIGTFSGGIDIMGADFDRGVILSSGQIKDVVGPNGSDFTSTANNLPGDPFLDNLIQGFKTADATSLEIEFTCPAGFDIISINYVFASDEYNEHVGSGFNDMFAAILDEETHNEQNIALLPDGSPVVINYVNGGNPLGQNARNADAFIDNDPSAPAFNFEPDGFTVVLTATGSLGEDTGPHRIRFVVADGYLENDVPNNLGNTWVFLRAGSLQCAQSPEPAANIPPIALCRDRTVAADPETCVAKADVDAGSIDPDGDPVTLRQSSVGPYKLGESPVTLTVADDSGTSDSCRATVTVVDTTPPTVSCRAARHNRSGIYRVTSSDCSPTTLTIGNRKLADGTTNDETIKLTRTPGRRSIRTVNKNHFLVGSKDIVIKAQDTAGNIATATCILPPLKSRGHRQVTKSRGHRQVTKSRGHRH